MSAAEPTTRPGVEAKVRVVPARRTASYSVPITANKRDDLVGKVNAKSVVITGGSGSYRTGQPVELPKTIAAINALDDLVAALRQELFEQGVVE